MNCSYCNAPLPVDARFCRNCGQPAPVTNSSAPVASNPSYGQPFPQAQGNMPPYLPTQPVSPVSQVPPMPSTQPVAPIVPGQFGQNQLAYQGQASGPAARKRRWPKRTIITLLVLVILIVGGWFLVARPILHAYAQGQLDQVLSSDINMILPVPPPIDSLTATEAQINNLVALNASSGAVQDMVVHISTNGVQLTFSLYGFSCSVTAIPQASNGNIVVTNVQVSGIISLVISADELTSDLNTQFQSVSGRLLRPISSVTLKNGEIDIGLGSSPLG